MTIAKHIRSVSRAASQKLGILKKSWRMFHDRSLHGRCFRGFVLPVLEYCSAVYCSAAYTHPELLDRAVSGARFLAGGCLSVALFIVDLWQYCVCCKTSGVTRCTVLRRWYITQREAHFPDCYISNFRVTSAEHDTLQFCMELQFCRRLNSRRQFCCSMHRGRVLVCRAAPCMIWTSTSCQHCWYWSKYYKKEEQEEIVKEIQVCAK